MRSSLIAAPARVATIASFVALCGSRTHIPELTFHNSRFVSVSDSCFVEGAGSTAKPWAAGLQIGNRAHAQRRRRCGYRERF